MYCDNCGCEVAKRVAKLRRSTKSGQIVCDLCNSVTKVKTKFGQCFSHNGDFDENDEPVNKFGSKVLPGYRRCGYRDCVNREHIIPAYEFERYSVSRYLGEKMKYSVLFEKIVAESK